MSIKEKPLEPDLRHAWRDSATVLREKISFCSVFLIRSVAKDR